MEGGRDGGREGEEAVIRPSWSVTLRKLHDLAHMFTGAFSSF